MQTFAVSDVPVANQLLEPIAVDLVLAQRLAEPLTRPLALEACGSNRELVAARGFSAPAHPLIEAVHTAFAEHYPLVLSPDDVWLCLAQGFALHVEANAEALRSRFVRHEDKLTLTVQRDEFVKGSPDNDWQGCFAEWSDAIAAHIGKKRDLIVAAFSTTGPIERAASEIVLMSAMKNYFDFVLVTLCGIPAITLLGTVEDWQAIRRRAEMFAEFDLADWVRALLPVLDQFVKAAAGVPDRTFWQSIYKDDGGSGGPYVTGWITVLFPYLDGGGPPMGRIVRNDYALAWSSGGGRYADGPTLGRFPRGLSRVPLTWEYLETTFPMTLQAGFVGISQDRQTRAVQPAIGWAVHAAANGASEPASPDHERAQSAVSAPRSSLASPSKDRWRALSTRLRAAILRAWRSS
jgi:hypothetical protein